MLSYRHAFHAGNHGDVLKHLILAQTIDYVRGKDKPFVYIDTHAGAGRYDLHSEWAQKNREFENGVARIWQRADTPACLQSYLSIIRNLNPGSDLHWYPGSPLLAKLLLRSSDKSRLFELHSNEVQELQKVFSGDGTVVVDHVDGFTALYSILPPAERRAVVLIDPSYENKGDFIQVVTVLKNAYRKFATGIYLLWYPVIWRKHILQLEENLRSSGILNILLCELLIAPDSANGLTGSGMIVVNPPWVLMDNLKQCMPYLARHLARDETEPYRLQMLVEQ